jgi:hypothetical protein
MITQRKGLRAEATNNRGQGTTYKQEQMITQRKGLQTEATTYK